MTSTTITDLPNEHQYDRLLKNLCSKPVLCQIVRLRFCPIDASLGGRKGLAGLGRFFLRLLEPPRNRHYENKCRFSQLFVIKYWFLTSDLLGNVSVGSCKYLE